MYAGNNVLQKGYATLYEQTGTDESFIQIDTISIINDSFQWKVDTAITYKISATPHIPYSEDYRETTYSETISFSGNTFSSSISINIDSIPVIDGLVYAGENLLQKGFATLYEQSDTDESFIQIDTISIINGSFQWKVDTAITYKISATPHIPYSEIYKETTYTETISFIGDFFSSSITINLDSIPIEYYSVKGLVYAGENLLPTGNVILLKQNEADNSFFEIDTVSVTEGTFEFLISTFGDYTLIATPATYMSDEYIETAFPAIITVHESLHTGGIKIYLDYKTNMKDLGSSPSFKAFPNPTKGEIYVCVAENFNTISTIEAITTLGRVMQCSFVQNDKTITIDTQNLNPGIYTFAIKRYNASPIIFTAFKQ